MKIYVLGNPLIPQDSLPLTLARNLHVRFPQSAFYEVDPTENFIPEADSVIIDTVVGLSQVQLFESTDYFTRKDLVTVHDYDLYIHLALLQKLGKICGVRIIGVPSGGDVGRLMSDVASILHRLNA